MGAGDGAWSCFPDRFRRGHDRRADGPSYAIRSRPDGGLVGSDAELEPGRPRVESADGPGAGESGGEDGAAHPRSGDHGHGQHLPPDGLEAWLIRPRRLIRIADHGDAQRYLIDHNVLLASYTNGCRKVRIPASVPDRPDMACDPAVTKDQHAGTASEHHSPGRAHQASRTDRASQAVVKVHRSARKGPRRSAPTAISTIATTSPGSIPRASRSASVGIRTSI